MAIPITALIDRLEQHRVKDPATEDERELAVTLILKSGFVLEKVVIWDINRDMVRVHALNDKGRRVYVVIDEIAVICGGLDD